VYYKNEKEGRVKVGASSSIIFLGEEIAEEFSTF